MYEINKIYFFITNVTPRKYIELLQYKFIDFYTNLKFFKIFLLQDYDL